MCRPLGPVSVIYLLRRSPDGSSGLPPGTGRAILDCRCIWPCNPQDVRPPESPSEPVVSYTTFSPLPPLSGGGYFLSHLPRRRRRLPVRMCGALCCPDFPLRINSIRSDRPHFCFTKLLFFYNLYNLKLFLQLRRVLSSLTVALSWHPILFQP